MIHLAHAVTQIATFATFIECVIELLLGKMKTVQEALGIVRQGKLGHLLFSSSVASVSANQP